MAIKDSGQLSLNTDIVGEFEGNRPYSLSSYYSAGGLVPAGANPNIPESGEISFSDFYGAVNVIIIEMAANQYTVNGVTQTAPMGTTLNLYSLASSIIAPVNGEQVVPFKFIFDTDTIFNNSIEMGGDFFRVEIINDGIIAGRGGDGAGWGKTNPDNGAAAIKLNGNANFVEITNTANGYIAGGGNGGGASSFGSSGTRHAQKTNSEGHVQRVFKYGTLGGGGGWNGGLGGASRAVGYAEVRSGSNSSDGHEQNSPKQGADFQAANQTRNVITSRTGGAGASGLIANTGLVFAGTFNTTETNVTQPSLSGASGTSWRGSPGNYSLNYKFSVNSNTVGGAQIWVKASSGSNGGAALPPDTGGGTQATGPGGGNSVLKTGTITTLNYVGDLTRYYGTRDT